MISGLISKLVKNITLSRVIIWSLTSLLCISLFTVYENRKKLITFVDAPKNINSVGITFSVSPETQARLIEIIGKTDIIIGVSVMSADLRLNEARTMFFFGDDAALIEVGDRARQPDSNRLPLFAGIEENDAEVIKLINGQFSCVIFEHTLEARIYPSLKKTVRVLCRSSIPSYYGYFSGYLQFYLNEEPSTEKQLQLKLMVEKLSNDIYFKDVLPTQRSEKVTTENRQPNL